MTGPLSKDDLQARYCRVLIRGYCMKCVLGIRVTFDVEMLLGNVFQAS